MDSALHSFPALTSIPRCTSNAKRCLMEAITAATMGALTLYDMLKGVDKALVVTGSRVIAKEGGKSGGWKWDAESKTIIKTSVTS